MSKDNVRNLLNSQSYIAKINASEKLKSKNLSHSPLDRIKIMD